MKNKIELNDNTGLDSLVKQISTVQEVLQGIAAHAINLSLTARNWLVGYYIVEYEQHGEDRAQYGTNLLNTLSKRLSRSGMEPRRLREYRQFYICYPYLGNEVLNYLQKQTYVSLPVEHSQKWRSATAILQINDNEQDKIWRLTTAKLEDWQTPPDRLFNRLSATHLIYLSNIRDELKRAFYEQEAIRGCWTVKELDRQVSSLYYERMGVSMDKKTLQRHVADNAIVLSPKDIIRDPVSLEFLGLQEETYTETSLEKDILDHLQHFMLEMGRGFCFEARQKRILIDQDYFKADLIFYHRILKCHVIVDLKTDRFRHEYASQLNMYLNYYRHEVMQPDDNPPVGLLLCTDYGETTVRYATEGLSQNLFVSKYQLQLPSTEELRRYMLENFDDQTIAKYKEQQRQSE
ncbi:MAG: PDDEXK nuclease domain-containing protein [Bacteroidales bacterium]|nr:PDDEXK nuclease domain-containing protein [Bacteroidales bacterium]